jgi:hypothetical protein
MLQRQGPEFERLVEAKERLADTLLQRGIDGGVAEMVPMAAEEAVQRAGNQVHAVGIGQKVVNGETKNVVRVYVVQKLRKEDGLRDEDIIPPFADPEQSIPTDVIEAPVASFLSLAPVGGASVAAAIPAVLVGCSATSNMARPTIIGGISTGFKGGSTGTIACFCRSRNGTNGTFVLSNRHVYVGASTVLVQPSSQDVPPFTEFADLHTATAPINFGGAIANHVDAAVGLLRPGIQHAQLICGIGAAQGKLLASHQMPVRKHGRATGLTHGNISDISWRGLVGTALFDGQIRIQPAAGAFADNGDSGSLLVAEGSRDAVGLVFAKSGNDGLANYIDDVLDALDMDLE